MPVVGQTLSRTDGLAKVTGASIYTVDYSETGMLHGCLLRSAVVAGRITRIDTSEARVMPGVRAVLTASEAPRGRAGQQTALTMRVVGSTGKVAIAVEDGAARTR